MTVFWINPGANGRLGIVQRPRGNEWLQDDLTALRRDGVDILVSMLTRTEAIELGLTREQALCEALGIEFRSLPILDHSVPTAHREMHELAEALATERRHGKNIGGSLYGRDISRTRLRSHFKRPRAAGAGHARAGGVAGGVCQRATSVLSNSGRSETPA
jgi:hypothetical protein